MKNSLISKPFRFLLFFLIVPCMLSAQKIAVTGTVRDAKGEPLIGVSVVEKGTSNGMSTGIDGDFKLTVEPRAVLEVTYLGYTPQSVSVNGRTRIDITLEEDAKALEEVVVIGYGTQRREAVTGSVATISGTTLREIASGNITQSLQDRIAGIELSQTSSQPGATMQIRIRGTRSLTASNDPLIVVDGIPFPGNISDIDPNSIKSMDILKDASATAIYGSRGANGVILITTDKGSMGAKPRVNYNGYVGAKTLFSRYPMMDGAEFAQLRKDAGLYQNSLDESDSMNTDWQELFYRTGYVQSHDVSVAGSGTGSNYNVGLGYYKEQGVVPTQAFERLALRASLEQEVGKNFKFGLTTNNSYSLQQGSNVGSYGVLSMSPLLNPYDENGEWKRTLKMPLDEQFSWSREVVESLADRYLSHSKSFASYNNLYAEIKAPWVEGLKYRINVGLNLRHGNGGSFTGEGVGSTTITTPSTASISNSLSLNWAVENIVSYDRVFANTHRINAVALYSAEQTTYNSSYVAAKDIPAEYFQYYNLGQAVGEITVNPNYQSYSQRGLTSSMARLMYSYADRYMISASIRDDASSVLAPGHKHHTYPAVSLGWNITEESFMEKYKSLVSQLKLRIGYGQTSNQSISPYSTLGGLGTRPYNFGGEYATGYYVSSMANQELGWEYTHNWNFGLDFQLLNRRISGTIEYYIQNTKDLLMSVNLPVTSGVSSVMQNIGSTQNKGIEFTLNANVFRNQDWSWDVGFNIYANRNKITKLDSSLSEDGKPARDEANWWFEGYPINVIFDYEKIGIWQEGDPYLSILEPSGQVGMIKVKYAGDYNADGSPTRMIGADDRQIMNADPDFQGGFNTRVGYKGFDLTVVGGYKHGGILVSSLYSSNGYLNMMTGRRGNVKVDYWTPTNTDAKYPAPGKVLSGDNPKYGSTLGYFDATYLKVRTITLGYNVPQKLMKTVGAGSLRIYATVQNPFVLFSPYHDESGMDPETNSTGMSNVAVGYSQNRTLIIGTNAPQNRNYLVGLNLSF